MVRRFVLCAVVIATTVFGFASGASAGTTIGLVLSQSDAFTVLGHSCGGIQEQTYATGFDAASGYPVGDVYAKTSCGGSGRGGGYTVTTYSAWIAVTWDFTGAVVTYAKDTSAVSVNPNFSAFDGNGNEIYNASNNAYLTLAAGYVPTPRVTSVSVTTGPSSGGTAVTVTGDAFTATSAVSFGGTPAASFTINSDTSITALSPTTSAGTVDITVTSPGGTSATSAADRFTFVAAPTVTAVSPNSGPVSGGTAITLTGTGFTGASLVSFGADPAAFTVNSDTSMTAISPFVETPDTVDITVTTIGGTSTTTPVDQFTYGSAPACSGPCVSVGDGAVLEGDAGTHSIRFPITLSQRATTTISVQYTVSDSTATGGSTHSTGIDYSTKSGTVSFVPGTTGLTPIEKFVTVPVYGDTIVEPDETFTVTLANPTGGYVLGRSLGTGTILNDDGITSGITIGIGDSAVVVANTKEVLTLPVTLSAKAAGTVTVDYTVDPDTARYSATAGGGGDYGGKTSGTLTFLAGTITKTLSFPIWANASPSGDKGFTVTLSNVTGTGITLIRDTGTATILG